MRFSKAFVVALAVSTSPAAASWWSSSKPEYSSWNTKQLKAWLDEHEVYVPVGYSRDQLQSLVGENWSVSQAWTHEQYARAQAYFAGAKDTAFDSWDDSRLRQFLLDQGLVSPSGPREQLVLAAKQHYNAYTRAASTLVSSASAAASTAVYGDTQYQASKSAASLYTSASDTVSSAAAQASASLVRAAEDSKDYVYSTWSDSQLRSFLAEKGVIQVSEHPTRDQMLAYMRDSYAAVTEPVWKAWSDSYIHEWLVAHGIIKSDFQNKRDALVKRMESYYYSPQQKVYDAWTESDMRDWLIEHNVIKHDVIENKLKKEKMQKLIADNYASASDTVWGAWSDSDIRAWLIEHGYLRSDAQINRNQLVKLINDKYNDASARTAPYLTWPDARLRAFLRSNNMSEDALPTSRPGLLQECRIRYVQTTSSLEQIYAQLRALVASGVSSAEETLGQILELLSGAETKAKGTTNGKKAEAEKKVKDTKDYVEKKKNEL